MAEVMKAAGGCPDLETIAAYLDGRLSDRERARVTEHLAGCEDCDAIFRESAQTQLEGVAGVTSIRTWRERLARPRVLWPSAAALAMAAAVWLAVGVAPTRMGPAALSSGAAPRALLEALVEAGDRPVEGRLSGFTYVPLRGPVRSGVPATRIAPDVRIAAARSANALTVDRAPAALHDAGLGALSVGDLDRAVPLLEQAVEQTFPDAWMLNDLSSAYLARAARDDGHQDLEKALAAADRALKSDSTLTEASFNRALALERLGLAAEARSAWQDYLRVDDRSGWADEARAHLSAIR